MTRAQIVRFLAYLLEGDPYAATPHARRFGSVSASTRSSVIGTLNAFYAYLHAVNAIDENPVDDVPRPKKRYRPGITLSADEIRKLLDVRGTPRERVQTHLLVFTAARAGELRELTWSDVNFKRRAVHAGLHELPSANGEYRSLVSPHSLRRSFATILLKDGHHLDAVADVLGHKSLDTTRKHYAFASNERRRATVKAFNV